MNQRKIENVTGTCEECGSRNLPQNLYVHLYRHMWQLICPTCFYRKYNNLKGEKEYYSESLIDCPDMLSYKAFKRHNKAMIVLGDAYAYRKEDARFFSDTEKSDCLADALKKFESDKLKAKFNIVNVQSKTNEQIVNGGVTLIVAIRCYARFKSYLEYLEHEMYLKFKKDCTARFS